MHLILTGATGLVGSAVLDAMLAAKEVTKISILSRRPVRMAEDRATTDGGGADRVRVIVHSDFTSYDAAVLDKLKGAVGCVWALGVSQNKVTADEYVRITKDYPLAAAKAFATLPTASSSAAPFRFVYVSGEGATQTPGRFSAIFARVKGETEKALAELSATTGEKPGSQPQPQPLLRADSVRPAFVDAANHAAIKPYIPNPGLLYNATVLTLGPVFRSAYRRMHSPTEVLGGFLTQLAAGGIDDAKVEGPGAFRLGSSSSGSWVVENVGFRRIMGL
ncbi:nucleoside-diphosphate-sugar epimerase [Hirsutella rhossiliensis]|uniref:Nucleoside-diphosphate-sugar epimerase n=1 Tax=Hirsutella rhossiliensis TaxID=111463 RepID=A0A9P8MVD6_9HYPO|nr:nucleoside-diphosphate-sugar epimerase [Hirsutella rhossiliensis]KAH0961960.1 nucleoside-diphosphate-sugar epimerase [Hirsutella rhossiliensis]